MLKNVSKIVFDHVTLIEDGNAFPGGSIVVQDGIIQSVNNGRTDVSGLERVIDGNGWLVAPGFVDLQVNGAYGHDFTQEPGAIALIAQRLPETGVVAFLPTFISSAIEEYSFRLQAVAEEIKHENGARVLGAHLEGPFLSPEKPGAHNPNFFCAGDPSMLAYLSPLDAVRLVTLAAEVPSGLSATEWLTKRGVTVSIGHSAATADQLHEAIRAGASYVTHLFNAMPPLHHRQADMTVFALTSPELRSGLIVDGIHVHPQMVKLAWRCLGAKQITLVTDCMAAMGMPDGVYSLGGQTVHVSNNKAQLGDGTLAGSVLRMDQAVRNLVTFTGCNPSEALRAASTTPLEVLGLGDRMGHLLPGFPADLVILDEALQVQATLIRGEVAYATPPTQKKLG